VRRRLALIVLVCLTVPAVALAAGDPKERFTSADQAKARSVVLKRSDFVAGWKRSPATPESNLTCPGFDPDGSDLTISGKAEANFEHTQGQPMIGSFAEVYASPGDALKSWSRTMKPALVGCVAHFFSEGVAEAGGKVKIVKQGRMAFPKVSPRTAAFRITGNVTFTTPGKPATIVPFTIHLVALGHGRGDAGLLAVGFGKGVSTSDLRAFAGLIASRLAAAKL